MTDIVILGGGISGLATAYNLQKMAKEAGLNVRLTLVEKEERVGGKFTSVREKGFLCEGGPPGFLDNRPETLKLCNELGLEMLRSKDASKKRFIYTGGRLHILPESPGAFLKSGILSPWGKLRVLLEPFTKPSQEEDETVAGFARRHLGKEAAEKLIGAMIAGIYAGDSEQLSLKSCFPVMLELEKEGNGSLIRAMIRRMRAAKKGSKAKALPSGNLTSFKDGIVVLTGAIRKALEGEVLSGRKVEKLSRSGKGYDVFLEGEGVPLKADVLVLALPAYAAAGVLSGLNAWLSKQLTDIPYVPASVVCVGYREEDMPYPLGGFGFLIPKGEGRRILGCRWDSSTFDYRAPPGHVLLEVIVGGAANPDAAFLDDGALLELVKGELRDTMGLVEEPVFVKIFKHEKAIPQYVVGHAKKLEEIEEHLKSFTGLFITGNSLRGISVNDCTTNAPIVARKVIEFVKSLKR